MLKSTFMIFTVLSLSAWATEYETQEDSNPVLCQQMRAKAQQVCRGSKSCYTAELSRLVDFYNSELRWDDHKPELFCNY